MKSDCGGTIPCLSIRQPWASAIFLAGKDCENRSRRLKHRGELVVHASGFYSKTQLARDLAWIEENIGVSRRCLASLETARRGGLIGLVGVVDCVSDSSSVWFQGPWALALANARPIEFVQYSGRLGVVKRHPELPPLRHEELPPPLDHGVV